MVLEPGCAGPKPVRRRGRDQNDQTGGGLICRACFRRLMPAASSAKELKLVSFLAQRFGQTRPKILGGLAARILADLRGLLRDGLRFFEKLLPDRLTIKGFHFA